MANAPHPGTAVHGSVEWLSRPARTMALFLLAVFPAALLINSTMGSAILGILALGGLLVAGGGIRLSREDKLMAFAFTAFFVVALIAWLAGEPDSEGWRKLGRHARLLLFVPVFFLFRRVPDGENNWWLGMSVAALAAGLVAMLDSFAARDVPAGWVLTEFTAEPVQFAVIALLVSFSCLVSVGGGRREVPGSSRRVMAVLAYPAFLLAAFAVLVTGVRGVWVALPGMLALVLYFVVRHQRDWQRLGLAALLILLVFVAYAVPQSGLERNITELGDEFAGWMFADRISGALALRADLALASWHMFVEHPFLGVGTGRFGVELQALVEAGVVSADLARHAHPHSEILLLLATRGLFGLVAAGLIFGIPFAQFMWAANHPDVAIRRLAYGGLIIVVGYVQLGFIEPVFDRSMSITFYVVSLAALWGLLRGRESAWLHEPKDRRETISVTVITLNEADRIGRCLDAVAGWADEIVVLDSGSTDRTVEIVRRYTDKVEVTDWPGYGIQKQRAAERCSCDWVFSIDADEVVPDALKREIDGELSGQCAYDTFRFPWSVEIFGRNVDFGADGRKHLRLFRREGPARFNSATVHEGVIPGGRMRSLHGAVIHETFRDFRHLLEKFSDYAVLQAKARHAKGRRTSVAGAVLRSLFSFLSLYVYRLGLLDGRRGLLMATLYAHYTFNKYAALWSLQQKPEQDTAAD